MAAFLSDKPSPIYERGYRMANMTREEKLAKLAGLRSEVEELIKSYNDAYQSENLKESNKADADMTEKINEYTSIVQEMCFEDCKNTGDAMLAAVKTLSFVTISTKDEDREDSKYQVRVLVEKEKPIDLHKLHKFCGQIGKNKNWADIAQKMNFLLTAQKAKDLGVEDIKKINDSYAMTDIARQFDMGKNPTSKTNLLKTLQTVVSAMLGEEYKATSHDVNFLMSVYSKKGKKALTVSCANERHFVRYIAEVCHRIATGKSYSVEYKAKKTAAPAPAPESKKSEAPKSEEKAA